MLNNNPQPYALYLDDCRNPTVTIDGLPWVIARTYEEFKHELDTRGMPDFVSLDHDLFEEHMQMYFYMRKNGLTAIDYSTFEEKTGVDCCKALVYAIDANEDYPRLPINLHTHNKYGLKVMYDYLRTELKYPKITTQRLPHVYVEELLPASLKR